MAELQQAAIAAEGPNTSTPSGRPVSEWRVGIVTTGPPVRLAYMLKGEKPVQSFGTAWPAISAGGLRNGKAGQAVAGAERTSKVSEISFKCVFDPLPAQFRVQQPAGADFAAIFQYASGFRMQFRGSGVEQEASCGIFVGRAYRIDDIAWRFDRQSHLLDRVAELRQAVSEVLHRIAADPFHRQIGMRAQPADPQALQRLGKRIAEG